MSLVDTGEDELDYGEEEAVVDRDTPISALVEDEMPQEDEDENEEEEEEEEEGYGDLYDDIDISSFEDPSHPSASKAVAAGGFSFEEEGRGSSKVGGGGSTGPALGTLRFDGKPVGAGGVPDLPTSVSCAAVSMSGDGRGVSPPPSGDHARPKKEAVPEITQFPSMQPKDEEEEPAAAAMVDVSSLAMDPKKSSSEEAIKRGNGGSGGSIGGGVGVYTIAQVEPPAEPVRSSYEQTLPSSRAPYAGFVKNTDSVTTLSHQEAVKAPNRAIQGGGGGGVQKDPPPKYVGQSQTGDGGGGGGGGGSTMLFVGDLHWWTTDAELEAALSEYGQVKNLKFFEERASGKSKGYCQVEVYDPAAAAACKEGMNGKLFNGRPCVVAFATPRSIQQMGTAQSNKAQGGGQQGPPQHRRTANNNDGGTGGGGRASDGTHNNNNNNYGKSGSGSGFGSSNRGGYGQSSGGKGGQSGFGRGRGNTGGSKGGSSGGRGSYNQGHPGLMGPHGHPSGMMMPQGMMGQGYESAYGPPSMGRGNAGYGGYIMPGTPFSGMLPPFPSMGPGGLPGVAPHINPAFFGRSAAANGMGVLPTVGMEGPHHGMWGGGGGGGGGESNMGGWGGGDNSERRSREESYGEDGGGSEYGYGGDGGHEKGQGRGATRERADGDWTERRRRDDRDGDWDNRDRHWDRERDRGRDDDRDRERPTRGRNKQWPAQDEKDEEDSLPPPRSRGGDGEDYKRRRLGSDR